MNYDLTVIIPTYNNEKYIEKCIKSALDNTCKIQIIVINDNSTDNTEKVLKQFNKEIKVINSKDNKGVSAVRNKGIKEIKGKYFTFLDGDDYVEPHAYDKVLNIIEQNELDLCGFNFYEIYNNKKVKSKYTYDSRIINKNGIIIETLLDKIAMVVWNKIYKTEVYKNVFFNEELNLNEDYEYTMKCIVKTKKSMFINEYLYNYFKNNNSLTSKYTCNQIKKNNYIKKLDDSTKNKIKKYKEYEYYISNDYLKQIHLYSKCTDKENRYQYLKDNINKKELGKLLKKHISKATKIEILIFIISTRLHLILFPIYLSLRNKKRKEKK